MYDIKKTIQNISKNVTLRVNILFNTSILTAQ